MAIIADYPKGRGMFLLFSHYLSLSFIIDLPYRCLGTRLNDHIWSPSRGTVLFLATVLLIQVMKYFVEEEGCEESTLVLCGQCEWQEFRSHSHPTLQEFTEALSKPAAFGKCLSIHTTD